MCNCSHLNKATLEDNFRRFVCLMLEMDPSMVLPTLEKTMGKAKELESLESDIELLQRANQRESLAYKRLIEMKQKFNGDGYLISSYSEIESILSGRHVLLFDGEYFRTRRAPLSDAQKEEFSKLRSQSS